MSGAGNPEEILERYLGKVRGSLRGLPAAQVEDIVRELRSHVLDRAGEPLQRPELEAALLALGNADEIAAEYRMQDLFERASVTRSPLLMLQSLFHWATLSVRGFFTASVSLGFYLLGLCFALAALSKPFHPAAAGLWRLSGPGPDDYSYSLALGFGNATPQGQELLGWWLVPLGLLLGFAIIVLTYRYDLSALRELRRRWQLPSGI